MNKKQYNNVINWTLQHEKDLPVGKPLEMARAIFLNMGVSLPNGTMEEVYEIMKNNDYMGWTACTMKEAQEAADNGTAAIGICKDRMVVLAAVDEDEAVVETEAVMTLSENTSVSAVSDLQYYAYTRGTTTQTPVVNSYNKDYRGCQILTASQLSLLESNKPFYQNAANTYGIPWKMLAAIHYREYKLKKEGPSNGDGPYQIWGSNYPVGALTDEEFQKATNDAASFIKQKANGRDLSVDDNVKYTFFAYNGIASAYKTQALNLGYTQAQANIGEGSPYVMNRADLLRDPTVEPTKSNKTWGQIKTDGGSLTYPANSDHGAYIVYKKI